MDIKDFLTQVVDGYLVRDLESMSPILAKEGEVGGGVGYPMLMTIISGIELLGSLLTAVEFDPEDRKYEARFKHYWDNYLQAQNPNYSGFSNIIYSLVRHGLAHNFLAAVNVFVYKDPDYTDHLKLSDGQLYINVTAFTEDFVKSYKEIAKRRILSDDDLLKRAQHNLDIILELSHQESSKLLRGLPTQKVTVSSSTTTALEYPASSVTVSGVINKPIEPDNI
jgi:hypothetical protein